MQDILGDRGVLKEVVQAGDGPHIPRDASVCGKLCVSASTNPVTPVLLSRNDDGHVGERLMHQSLVVVVVVLTVVLCLLCWCAKRNRNKNFKS